MRRTRGGGRSAVYDRPLLDREGRTEEHMDVIDRGRIEGVARSCRVTATAHRAAGNIDKESAEFWTDLAQGEDATAAVLEALVAWADTMQAGIKAVAALIDESYGVAGYHLNGDVASWDELINKYPTCAALMNFDTARDEMARWPGKPTAAQAQAANEVGRTRT